MANSSHYREWSPRQYPAAWGQDEEKVRAVIDKMKTIDSSIVVSFIKADFDSLASVKEAVRKILDDASIPTIDVLIKNAGIMAAPYQKTVES
jgi:NAD(P)-dependent dehydrogenase (short-subunit alcohol dehydrogenase family)